MGIIDNHYVWEEYEDVINHKKDATSIVGSKTNLSKNKSDSYRKHRGKVKDIRPYGILVDIGNEVGLVSISNLSNQFVNASDISDMYQVGDWVDVAELGRDIYNRLQLGIKQLYSFSYTVGDQLSVIVKRSREYGLDAITTEGCKDKCFIPTAELSWTGNIDPNSLIGEKIVVKITKIDVKKHQITCSLKQIDNPWEKPTSIAVGTVIDVKVIKVSDDGLKISTEKEGIPGFIHKNQITWLVADENITVKDCPTQGSTIRVVVKKFNPKEQNLLCSIKEIQEDPWKNIMPGLTFQGKVIKGYKGLYTVKLDNDIICTCHDELSLDKATKYQFIAIKIDSVKRVAEVSLQAAKNLDKGTKYIKNFFSTKGVQEHVYIKNNMVLLPQNILYEGEPIAMPFAMAFIKYLRNNPDKFVKYEIISKVTHGGNYNFISVDAKKWIGTFPEVDKDAIKNAKFPIGNDIIPTENGFIVNTAGRLGYFKRENFTNETINSDDNNVAFVAFGHNMQIDRLSFIDNKDESNEINLNNGNFFNLDDDEIAVLTDEDRKILEVLVDDFPDMSKDNIHRVRETIYISYDPQNAYISAINLLLDKTPNYFSSNNFWLKSKELNNGYQELCIYDSNDIMIVCQAADDGIVVKRFYCNRSHSEVQKEYKGNSNALFLPAECLHLVKLYSVPPSFDAANTRLVLSRQYEVYARILPNLNNNVRKTRREIGKNYIAMSQYLKYQQNIEKKRLEGLEIPVYGNQIRIGTKNGNKEIGLIITNTKCSKLFGKDNDSQNVKITKNGEEKQSFATLQRMDDLDEFFITFNYTPNLEAFKADGFVITPNANIYHLQVQQRSVNDFIENGDLLTNLEHGEIEEPIIDNNIHFYDSKFDNVEDGNNQPIAIRKAVGNKDIFLIQGPPGTGKTSVIVEIIRQLVHKGEKVLVCSQAHSAVRNIYERLKIADTRINIGFLDENETMLPLSYTDHHLFLKNNMKLIDELAKGNTEEAFHLCNEYGTQYSESVCSEFVKNHQYIAQYSDNNVHDTNMTIKMLNTFKEEIEQLSSMQNSFYTAGHIGSLQVVMGTCIGIGTDRDICKSGVKFDTLIIDEAGKANLAETNVPMQLAAKYILVGDDNQLPPYMDTEEIKQFEDSEEAGQLEEGTVVKEALGMSLFEYFLRHKNFPNENKVLLNYQYRMNPIIGDQISSLFYGEKLHNGRGTELQSCDFPKYPDAITFINTGETKNVKKYNPYEINNGDGVITNPREIEIIMQEIVPDLENIIQTDSKLSIGIIAPYSSQVRKIKKTLTDARSPLADCVYTIDNIQGQEYDIVVVSFVRAFSPAPNRKVGFLDDLRRLNVALSRAKKKLIMVGNISTLTRPEAHQRMDITDEQKQPVEIFKRISSDAKIHTAELNMIDRLRKHGIKPGEILPKCTVSIKNVHHKRGKSNIKCSFSVIIGGDNLEFSLPPYLGLKDGAICDIKLTAYNNSKSDFAQFDIADPVVISNDQKSGKVRLADNSEKDINFNTNFHLFELLLKGDLSGVSLPLLFTENEARLDGNKLKQRVAEFPHAIGESIKAKVIAISGKNIYLYCGNAIGLMKSHRTFKIGENVECKVTQKDSSKYTVLLELVNKMNYYGY